MQDLFQVLYSPESLQPNIRSKLKTSESAMSEERKELTESKVSLVDSATVLERIVDEEIGLITDTLFLPVTKLERTLVAAAERVMNDMIMGMRKLDG